MYEKLELPRRATRGSAGYDLLAPFSFSLVLGETIKMTNDTREGKTLKVLRGTGFAQGIFLEYGITVDDEASGVRNGELGSTTR